MTALPLVRDAESGNPLLTSSITEAESKSSFAIP
jgi:hypothetical protein